MEFQVSPELLSIYLEDARVHLEALDHGPSPSNAKDSTAR
jgi:hypothetical protein